ncbi:hypothetical protein, partial [Pseudomonas sp. EGD-AK9]|uniref:hypothetical protein n=1 Tax=Pseudomonas sp. EGD-AK9 TaxID=1386078 RepID=UPI0015A753A7
TAAAERSRGNRLLRRGNRSFWHGCRGFFLHGGWRSRWFGCRRFDDLDFGSRSSLDHDFGDLLGYHRRLTRFGGDSDLYRRGGFFAGYLRGGRCNRLDGLHFDRGLFVAAGGHYRGCRGGGCGDLGALRVAFSGFFGAFDQVAVGIALTLAAIAATTLAARTATRTLALVAVLLVVLQLFLVRQDFVLQGFILQGLGLF